MLESFEKKDHLRSNLFRKFSPKLTPPSLGRALGWVGEVTISYVGVLRKERSFEVKSF